MDVQSDYRAASVKTASSLKAVASTEALRKISRLTLPEIEAVSDLIAQIVPAGNVPGMILTNLALLAGRHIPAATARRDVDLLFKGVEQMLDRAVYTAFFAGPAAIIWAYQNLLKLAGKHPESAFPDGTWQFYVEYALREDTARHTHETHGFHTALRQHGLNLSETDRIAAWVLAAIDLLHQYDALLTNEWRERMYLHLLGEVVESQPDGGAWVGLYNDWQGKRPYRRGSDATDETFSVYRRRKFDEFLYSVTHGLSPQLNKVWKKKIEDIEKRDLPAYLSQMSILAYLEPDDYRETRVPYPLTKACVAVIHRGHYYLIRACAPNADHPSEPFAVRNQIASILIEEANSPASEPQSLTSLANIQRTVHFTLRKQLSPALLHDLETLRLAPILINTGPQPDNRQTVVRTTLSELRWTERGVGDHPLTLFLTPETCLFDQSHIFFDGAWGAAFAEIMTNESMAWAVYLNTLPPARPDTARPYILNSHFTPSDRAAIQHAPVCTPEVSAETHAVQLKAILDLRRLFKRRSDLIQLTVNDLLILYRAIHNCVYRLNPQLESHLRVLSKERSAKYAALTTLQAIDTQGDFNPAILIPLDASPRNPRDRLYPMTFEVPLAELDLISLHARTLKALDSYHTAPLGNEADRTARFGIFDNFQRNYLAALAGFGAVLSRTKEVAAKGESASIGAIKMLAHLPAPLQKLLDNVSGQFDLLNDIVKGREVFSNIGVVAPKSTLTRFSTAKDDNEKKILVWGVITDANQRIRISLRDFRPHVGLLIQAGYGNLARSLTQDYLDAYADGLNQFVSELYRITVSSRETRM
jgi:hypothetical protein